MHLLKVMLKASGKKGVPQGGVISPLLSNLYLNEVDKMLERGAGGHAKWQVHLHRIGPISFGVKQMGARNAGNPHVACGVEGWRRGVGRAPGHTSAPALDPTDERDVETESRLNH
jgi:hypothetical protein